MSTFGGCWLASALVAFRPTSHFDGAVRIYRTCRSAGVTPRGLIDCMIVAVPMGYTSC